MLDEENSPLKRWFEGMFCEKKFDGFTVFATNLVKCTFPNLDKPEPNRKTCNFTEWNY